MFSERSLNSMLWMLHENNHTNIDYEFPSTLIKTFFPNFEEVYGHHEDLSFVVQSMSAPLVVIRDSLALVRVKSQIKFLNPYDSKFECLAIDVDMDIAIKLELLHGFTLSGGVVNLTMSVTNLETYFKSKVKVPELAKKIDALNKPIINAINS